uniref:hypothetical protein n=1 Tax=Actinomadura sp. CA-154981 TaxID=3240037 RepID=UPI003F49A872
MQVRPRRRRAFAGPLAETRDSSAYAFLDGLSNTGRIYIGYIGPHLPNQRTKIKSVS